MHTDKRTGDLSFTRHLTPALSPNFVGGEGEKPVTFLVFNP